MSETNIDIAKRGYAAFLRGDVPAILEMLADKVEGFGVISDGPDRAPWHGTDRHDRPACAGFFESLIGALEPLKFEPDQFAAAGDYVYVTIQHEYRVRKNGRILVMRDVFHRWKIVRGKVVEILCSEDTALTRACLEA